MTDSTFAKALAEFQKDLPAVTLDGDNPHFKSKYATLANVTNIVIPKLVEHGFAFTTGSRVEDGLLILEAKLLHESGEYESASFPIADTNPQKVGSAVTYYRRYALASLTGIVADADDDGNGASIPTVGEKRAQEASNAQSRVEQARQPNTPAEKKKTPRDEIRIDYVDTGKVTKDQVNDALAAYNAKGKSNTEAFVLILKDLKAGKVL